MAENTISEPFAHNVYALGRRASVTSSAVLGVRDDQCQRAVLKPRAELHRGLYTPEQITSWRKLTGAIRAKGGRMLVQLWYVGCNTPGHRGEALAGIVDDFRLAAAQAIAAGFDGVELHVTNGLLLQQFLRGDAVQLAHASDFSMEQRARLLLDVVGAVSREIGAERTGVLIAPPSASGGAESESRYNFIVGRLGVAYLRLVAGAMNRARDVTPFDCSLLDASLRPTQLLDQPRVRPAPERSTRVLAHSERLLIHPPMASDGQDRGKSNQVWKQTVDATHALPLPDRPGRQAATDTPTSRVERTQQTAITA